MDDSARYGIQESVFQLELLELKGCRLLIITSFPLGSSNLLHLVGDFSLLLAAEAVLQN